MNTNTPKRFGWLALALAATTAAAQTSDEKLAGEMKPGAEPSLNRFSAAFRAAFNLKPSFRNVGGFPEYIFQDPFNPKDRTYMDGYVRVDNSANIHGPHDAVTWFWAYASEATQIIQITPEDKSVLMHTDSAAPIDSIQGEADDPLPGFELTYNRQLGRIGYARWGLEAAFGYLNFDFKNQGSYAVTVSRREDRYDPVPDPISGHRVIYQPEGNPPNPPFGTFTGPGQLLGDAIISSLVDPNFGSTSVAGERRFEGALYSGRLGPYLEIPLTRKLAFSLSGGLSLVGAQSDFSYNESLTIAGLGTEGHQASGSNGDILVGGYVGGNLSYQLGASAGIFVGGQFQSAGTYAHPLDNVGSLTRVSDHKAAELNLSQTFFFTVGLSWSF